MPHCDLFSLPKSGALLGIDPGQRTLGLALSDTQRLIASPMKTLQRGRKLAPVLDQLFDLYDARSCVGIVLGLPLNMDGSSGPRTQATQALAHQILKRQDVPLAFQDERLSSAEAERIMLAADLSRARRAEKIDASAAAIILQTALDRLANQKQD